MELLKFTYRYVQVPVSDEIVGEKTESYIPMILCQFKYGNRTTSLLYGLLDAGSDCHVIADFDNQIYRAFKDAPTNIYIGRVDAWVEGRKDRETEAGVHEGG